MKLERGKRRELQQGREGKDDQKMRRRSEKNTASESLTASSFIYSFIKFLSSEEELRWENSRTKRRRVAFSAHFFPCFLAHR